MKTLTLFACLNLLFSLGSCGSTPKERAEIRPALHSGEMRILGAY